MEFDEIPKLNKYEHLKETKNCHVICHLHNCKEK